MEKITSLLQPIFDSSKEKDFTTKSTFYLAVFFLIYGIISKPLGFKPTIAPIVIIIIGFIFFLISLVTAYYPPPKQTDEDNQPNQNLGNTTENEDNNPNQISDNQKNTLKKERQEDILLYTLVGQLKKQPVSSYSFQNFNVSREDFKNCNPIYFMWADTYRKSSITASIEKPEDSNLCYLKVLFLNNPGSWNGNIAILPHDFCPIKRENRGDITFKAKLLKMEEKEERYYKDLYKGKSKEPLSEIAISIRLVDAQLQHWIYGSDAAKLRLCIVKSENDWQEFAVDIKDEEKWHLFEQDGNYLYGSKNPDFSVITLVILEFGGYVGQGLKKGFGSIGIKDICFK